MLELQVLGVSSGFTSGVRQRVMQEAVPLQQTQRVDDALHGEHSRSPVKLKKRSEHTINCSEPYTQNSCSLQFNQLCFLSWICVRKSISTSQEGLSTVPRRIEPHQADGALIKRAPPTREKRDVLALRDLSRLSHLAQLQTAI
eukprot:3978886-Amphidinium_carterae.1